MSPNQHAHRGGLVTAFRTTWYRRSGERLVGPYTSWQAAAVLPCGRVVRCGLRRDRARALAWGVTRINDAFGRPCTHRRDSTCSLARPCSTERTSEVAR